MSNITLPERFFVTGTDTDIGKTLISAILLQGLKTCYYKPVQSGCEEETDTALVKRLTGLTDHYFLAETYCTQTPCSPHLSARIDGINIDTTTIIERIAAHQGPLLIEGAGGLYVPLNDKEFVLDLMQKLGYPVVLVAKSGLGTINHTLLSVKAIKQAGLTMLGVVMSGEPNPKNRKAIETFGKVPVLAEIPLLTDFSRSALQSCFVTHFGEMV